MPFPRVSGGQRLTVEPRFALRWGRSETGSPVCWGPCSWHRLPPMGGNLARMGSGGAEGLPWRQHKRQERDMGRHSACRGTYMNSPPWDYERN